MPGDLVTRHVERIISVVARKGTPRDKNLPEADIARSWERCLNNYRIEPDQSYQTQVIEHTHLIEHQDRLRDTLEIARIEMDNLYQQISGSGYAVLLTDSEGVIINSVSDPTLVKAFVRAGLWLGAIWHEQQEGTNAIGTCLLEKHPLTVHRDEHFRNRHIGLTCSASPIFDPHGALLAVLDVSSVNCQDSKQSQFHTMALATLSAKLIENCNFLHQFRPEWVLRFHNRPEFVGQLSEGMLAFDGAGSILAANQSALNQLGFPDRRLLMGHSVSDIFDIRPDVLVGRASHHPGMVWPTHDRQGRSYFAMLRGPEVHPVIGKPIALKGKIGPVKTPLCMTLEGLKGSDPVMAYNVRCAQRVMDKNVNILLNGETGTGKEAFAKAVHAASRRSGKPFVAVNCASIPENLIESELFGYKHGAFTGARREGMRGKILQSSSGTLFLDEIGDMAPPLQTRLLRVLEEKEVVPLGCEIPIPVDLHVISATHRNLQELVASGAFREDLYYRLNGLTLTLPPLRERHDKTTLICCALAAESNGERVEIDEKAFAALVAYSWPGNIRQLRNVLRTAVALCEEDVIRVEDLPIEIAGVPPQVLLATCGQPALPAVAKPDKDDGSPLECAEKEALLRELDKHRWNITNTSAHLGMSRNTLYRKMKKHGIAPASAS